MTNILHAQKPRRRGTVLEEAITLAVRQEIADHGYGGVTFEGVAQRAATSKSVLYRRYGSRAELVFDAVRSTLPFEIPQPLPGTLRDDLVAVLESARARFAQVGVDTFRSLLGEADPALLGQIDELGSMMTREIRAQVVTPAYQRGELGPRTLSDPVISAPLALLRDRLTLRGTVDMRVLVDEICVPLFLAASTCSDDQVLTAR